MSKQSWGAVPRSLTGERRGRESTDSRTPSWHRVPIDRGNGDPIVPPREEEGAGHGAAARDRLRLSDVSVTQVGVTCEIRVTLAAGDERLTGTASSAAVRTARHRAVARATVDALNQLVGADVRLELLSLDGLSGSEAPARIVSSLLLVTPADTEVLVGAAREGDRPEMAVARATLAAVNRRVAISRD